MKKYKLVNGKDWEHFVEGEIYSTDYWYGFLVEHFDTNGVHKADWELVVEEVEITKKFKFKGDVEACGEDGSYGGLVVGDIYRLTDRCPDSKFGVEDYNFVKYYVEMYPNDWEEVTEQACVTIFTDAEVVTLITFLNDNFEDFNTFIESSGDGYLYYSFYYALEGGMQRDQKAPLLIDKLEKNNTPLTEAEKVTLITFLNDNFEDFRLFTEVILDYGIYEELDFDGGGVGCPLIDKIELS